MSTQTLQNSINYAQAFCRLQPLTGVGGVAGEPALTIGNQVKQFILGPPFAWRWNRARLAEPIVTEAGVQDYTVSVPDFGWMEKASVKNGTGTWEIEKKLVLADSSETDRPLHIAEQMDDGKGNITFRLSPVPDGIYEVTPIYQKKPTLFTSIAGKWDPIPDELAVLYNKGVLAHAFESVDDPRALPEMSLFLRQVIAANAGLKDSEVNLFLSERLVSARQQQNELMGVQQGRAARSI